MLRFGVCYHPEQWTAEQAKDHIKLLVKARVNTVRIGESCWARFEPEQGRFRFDWLDPVIESLRNEQIGVVLCTPTSIAPMWVHTRHPNVLRQDARGHRAAPGQAHACCVNAPEFQILTDSIVQQLARHYGPNETVFAWQIDNALGSAGAARCYCEHCEKAFRQWLLAEYKTTEAVNEAWAAASNGAEVRQWTDVVLPRGERGHSSPGHWLDFARFCSDALVAYHRRQADTIRAVAPSRAVLSNVLPRSGAVHLGKLAAHTDAIGRVSNPDLKDPYVAAYGHAILRSVKGPFYVLEQSLAPMQDRSGVLSDTIEPGGVRRWVWQAIANGAQGILLHPFRTGAGGADNLRPGVLDCDGAPRRRYKEVLRIGEELAKAGPVLELHRLQPKVGLLRSYDARWSGEAQPGAVGFRYDEHCYEYYRVVKRSGHACAIVLPESQFNGYSLIVAPALTVVDDALAARLEQFVRDGGTLILTPQSGSREKNNAMTIMPRPGLFAGLIGATVDEIVASTDSPQTISFARGALITQTCSVRNWFEVLELVGAEAVAEYAEGRLKGKAAIARRSVGNGHVIYIGVYLPRETLEAFIAEFLPEFPLKDIPPMVEVIQQKSEKSRLLFVINHAAERQSLKLPGQYSDLITGETVGPAITISSNGVLVLQVS